MRKILFALAGCWLLSCTALAQQPVVYPAAGSPAAPKVPIVWNRYHDSATLTDYARQLAKAYPELVKTVEIGRSYQNRPITALIITDFRNGQPETKPAYYVDGNIHSNEIQASEVCLYLAWYLAEMHATLPLLQEQLKHRTYYIVPTTNPDGRDNFLYQANTTHSPRSGVMPVDNDRDGLTDEDGPDDLDGNGHITMMRRRNPLGRYRTDPNDPRRMVLAPEGQTGEWEMLGYEGIDNDNDGKINEDGTGYYDPNRDWPWGWQPSQVQGGAGTFPFHVPENRAVAAWVLARPNIGGCLTFHNTGAMFLRGPSNPQDDAYPAEDLQVYNHLGKLGAQLLPGYKYINTYDDLYPVYGGQSDWFAGALGATAFTGELFSSYYTFHNKDGSFWGKDEDWYQLDKYLLMGDGWVDWKPYTHPVYGEIEIGGFKKNTQRINPGFLLEEECHRMAGFAIYHAGQLPQVQVGDVLSQARADGGIATLVVPVQNASVQPTHLLHDRKNSISAPNTIQLLGADILAVQYSSNPDFGPWTACGRTRPDGTVAIPHIPGQGAVYLRLVIKTSGTTLPELVVRTVKAGIARRQLNIRP